ncbi:hypothetical protein AMAG_04577 [Allomyces macrogynus ATCC 38327]|uniref:Extracellular membrane protein CFEM domain-containing protein n=1 Tax=Allomyces macrogynus (strain ATCC 38327) TaxID=578462 RepID=A0A0L0S5A3_ALLM3|nr:hypothetical protein AMAG_04577 [Allomyces macrogynus ATCC 38327]|eukprot:KNE57718.1 hypothetical protein AMAG_04577 [Allomyces macrogynus ATCC 38327]
MPTNRSTTLRSLAYLMLTVWLVVLALIASFATAQDAPDAGTGGTDSAPSPAAPAPAPAATPAPPLSPLQQCINRCPVGAVNCIAACNGVPFGGNDVSLDTTTCIRKCQVDNPVDSTAQATCYASCTGAFVSRPTPTAAAVAPKGNGTGNAASTPGNNSGSGNGGTPGDVGKSAANQLQSMAVTGVAVWVTSALTMLVLGA